MIRNDVNEIPYPYEAALALGNVYERKIKKMKKRII